MKPQTQTATERAAFKALNLKKVETLETQVKAIKGVKDVSIASKAKNVAIFISLKMAEDNDVFQKVVELVGESNFKLSRSYFYNDGLTGNLTQN